MSKFFVTTPIYYPSDKLHIGHAYTSTVADAFARWHKFLGEDVLFLTGSDEHGQKIQRIAKSKGLEPKTYVDGIVTSFKHLWQRLDVEYDDFIRTTDHRHHVSVQEVFRRIYAKGDIYKSKYQGWYCTPCETFWLENKLVEGNCPDCGRTVELVEEESYFFRMSRYSERLLAHIEANPDFIRPETRRNEMVNFIKGGLEDLCVSRTTFDWGIPVPMDEDHVVYVWFDALTNYITGAGFPDNQEMFSKWWPADVHLVGKEIVRFHTIIWPITLMALDLPLPSTVFGHGWLLFDSDKMSKSKGNVVDPHQIIDEFGVDPIRYFLFREISFGQDGNFNRRALIERTNADLANDLGNLLNRSLAMLARYFDGAVPEPQMEEAIDRDLINVSQHTASSLKESMGQLAINEGLSALWGLVGRANKYIDECAPWSLAKSSDTLVRLQTVMYNLVEVQRIIAILLKSFLPTTGSRIWAQLGIVHSLDSQRFDDTVWGGLQPGTQTVKGDPIFPRIEVVDQAEAEGVPSQSVKRPKPSNEKKPTPTVAEGVIGIDEFAKVELVVAKVLSAERVKGADKLLKLQIDVGESTRQIVAGIAPFYAPEGLPGRSIVVVKNLKPATLRGELSEGMLLAASSPDGKHLELVTVSETIPAGSRVK